MLVQVVVNPGGSPAAYFNVVVFTAPIRAGVGRQVGESQQLLLELTRELLFLLLQHRHLLLDGIALLAEFGDLVAFGISARLDALADFFADLVAFRLQAAALLL